MSEAQLISNNSLRAKTYQLLESETQKSLAAKTVTFFLILLILANVSAVILESEADFNEQFRQQFYWFEIVSLSIFCIEYLLRLWCCVESSKYQHLSPVKARLNYITTPIAIIDFIAILPFIIAVLFTIDLRSLRLLRVLRLLKLTHYFKGFNIFITVIGKEFKSLVAAMTVIFVLIIIAASLMHIIEGQAQPEQFGSILKSIWWAVVTMTTVGYGDVVPITGLGKLVSTFIMLIGIGLVALPAGMLAARFGEELRERRNKLNLQIEKALSDGHLDQQELKELHNLAEKLDIDGKALRQSIKQIKKGHPSGKCPHCGK